MNRRLLIGVVSVLLAISPLIAEAKKKTRAKRGQTEEQEVQTTPGVESQTKTRGPHDENAKKKKRGPQIPPKKKAGFEKEQ